MIAVGTEQRVTTAIQQTGGGDGSRVWGANSTCLKFNRE